MERSVRRDIVILAFGTLVLCGLFFGKAYHIDDPLVLWTAQRIAEHPWDFFGFDVNWYGYTAPMAVMNQNPPGAAYYAALFGAVLGWSEPVMHGSVALMAVALILGVYLIARQLNGEPLLAAVIALVSPGIFVSTGTVMTDLPMTTYWVWAIVFWIRGINDNSATASVVSAVLITLATLTKYFAISLVPLLMVFTFMSGRQHWARATILLIPLVALAGYELYTRDLYGTGHLLESFGYAKEYQERHGVDMVRKLFTGLAFLGAGGAPVLLLSPWLWGRFGRTVLLVALAGVGGLVALLAQTGWQAVESQLTYPWWFWAQYALWITAGGHIVVLTLADVWARRDRYAVLLALWIGGTLFFGMFLYHFVNIRVLLPALPAVAILCARKISVRRDKSERTTSYAIVAVMTVSLALTISIAYADARLANAARAATERIAPEKRTGTTWFSGHWGFQYYMQARGAQPIDQDYPNLREGDTVVTPTNAANLMPLQPIAADKNEGFDVRVFSWLTTMRKECGAGFYADVWGPLPFVFCPVPAEHYEVTVLGS